MSSSGTTNAGSQSEKIEHAHLGLFDLSDEGALRIANREFFHGTIESLLSKIVSLTEDTKSHLVVTPNVDQVINLQTDPILGLAYAEASILTVDGMPIKLLAKLLGANPITRITGAELLPNICASARFRGKRVVVTGGKTSTLERAVERLSTTYPDSDILSVPFPLVDSVGDQDCKIVAEKLQELAPDVVFVCLGSPKQEEWYLHWKSDLPSAVYIGAGAAVDFAAGTVKRAPIWIQRIGFEWAYRVLAEPKRLSHRYLVKGPQILPIFARSLLRHRQAQQQLAKKDVD